MIFDETTAPMTIEKHLRITSSRLAALIENQQSGVLIESEKGQIVQVNQTFCDLFDIPVPLSELVGTDCSVLAGQMKTLCIDSDGFAHRMEQLQRDKSMVINDVLHLVDGRVFQRDYIPIFIDNRHRGHLWQYREITEHRKMQERISVYERLCTALEQTADSVIITDGDGVIEYVNLAFETTTGYNRAEALGKTPRILKSGKHDKEFYRNLWSEILAGRSVRRTIVNRKKDGELYWAEQTITPMKDSTGSITHFVSVLKDITDLVEKKEREAQTRLAREVQQRFYKVTASIPGFDIAGSAYPVDETGGDYFDFISMPDGCLGIAVGDVSGHGIGAALVMAETRAYLRSSVASGADVAEILAMVNRALIPDLSKGQFVTLLVCYLNPRSRTLSFASAGHVPGYLINRDGEVDSVLGGTGPPLGLFHDSVYSSDEVQFSEAGQIMLLPTDGVTESRGPDEKPFGIIRALQYVSFHMNEPADQIIKGLFQAIRAQAAHQSQQDDITTVVLKVI
jgi:sigma-B regulation protein RsbU (phosphoserine phosphatase)